MSGQVSFCGEGMERVKGAVLEGPALVIAKKEMRSDDEIASYVNESIALLKRREKGCPVYVFLFFVSFYMSSSIHIGVRVFRQT